MTLEAYSPCPCGSGKKFKWCCQPFYSQIEKAFAQDANGQHEAAEAAMEALVKQFPDNAEVWGRRAEMLWDHQKPEEAEASVDQALKLNPKYAMGHYLRGMFRHQEGEAEGALKLYRRAAELCDPAASDLLAEIYISIAQCEFYRYQPLAAQAAIETALRLQPANSTAKDLQNRYFGVESPYPSSARKRYTLKALPVAAPAEQKKAWQQALAAGASGRLVDALKAFEKLVQANPSEPAALHNLALLRAWSGDTAGALAALENYVARESSEEEIAAAWTLAEVLRQGQGQAEHSDWTEQVFNYRVTDPQAFSQGLGDLRRLVDVNQHQGIIAANILDRDLPPAKEELALFEVPRVAASIVISRNELSLASGQPELLAKARGYLEEHLGSAIQPLPRPARPMTFRQIAEQALNIRMPPLGDEPAKKLIDKTLEQAFEHDWANRRLKSLGHRTPLEAMTVATLRPRVLGLVKLLEEIGGSYLPFPYDFTKLRQLLEAVALDPAAKAPAPPDLEYPTLSWKPKVPLAECSVQELNDLPVVEMSDADLQQALQAAQRHQHPRLIGTFAEALVERPPQANQDRYPLYLALINAALAENDPVAAENWVNAGLQFDCEHAGGNRRTDYELARAKVLVAAKTPMKAYDAYVKLIQRQPSNLEVLGSGAELMLKAGLRTQAAQFAEYALAQVKSKGDKARQGYFQDLLNAAKRG